MALHELATNATKYGALSVPSGRVDLCWTLDDGGEDGDRFGLTWTERGGPTVSLPTRRGFGTRMIEQALAHEFNGEVRQDWAPEGLVCILAGRLPAVAEG
jgi:two-component sensor histidine kinase